MKKPLLTLLLVIVVALFGLTLAKNAIAKGAVEQICRKITGLELKIGGFDLSFLKQSVGIKNLKLYNPPAYADRVMFDVPEVYGKVDVPSVFGSPIHVNELRLDLRQITIVKNKDGKLNLDSLKPADKKATAEKPTEEQKPDAAKKPAPEVHIDRLVLKVGKVVYKDYSAGGEPSVQEIDINLNETHENITNIQALIPIILSRAVMNTAVSQLVKLDLNRMLSDFDVSKVDLKAVGLGELEGAAKLFGKGTSSAGAGTEDTAAKAAKAVQGLFGAITGSSDTDTQ